MSKGVVFAVLSLAAAAQLPGQFQGPSIIGRSTGSVARDISEPAAFRVHGGVNSVYESNVLLPGDDIRSANSGQDLYGAEFTFGAIGSKAYKHSSIALGYEGSYRTYTSNAYYNGSDHIVALELRHRFSKRWSLTVRPTGGTLSRMTGGVLTSSLADTSLNGVPSAEVFDNRVYFTQGSADATYQASTRLSFNLGGDGFFVRRQNAALVGVDGASARADVAYRISKRQTVGAEYSYLHFTYDRAFGTYDAHLAAAVYSYQFNRRWQVNLRGGAYRVESMGLQVVTLDPVVAEILGTKTSTGVGYGVQYVPQVDAILRRMTKHGDITLVYGKRLNPGNGILRLARDETAFMTFSQAANRRVTFGFSGGIERLKGVTEIGVGFDSYTAGGGANYQLSRYLYLTGRLDWRQYELVNGQFNRNTSRVVVGLQYTSADTPVRVR